MQNMFEFREGTHRYSAAHVLQIKYTCPKYRDLIDASLRQQIVSMFYVITNPFTREVADVVPVWRAVEQLRHLLARVQCSLDAAGRVLHDDLDAVRLVDEAMC